MQRWMPIFAALVLASGVRIATAHASSSFPGAIKEHLALSTAPDCALCHRDGVTNEETATTPFARSMRTRGMVGNDATAALTAAVDQMVRDKVDSDGDGVVDIDELKAGTDPNVSQKGDGGTDQVPKPEYGCSAAPGSHPRSIAAASLVAAAVAVALRKRRARTSFPEPGRGQ